jgi:hypothetical protein
LVACRELPVVGLSGHRRGVVGVAGCTGQAAAAGAAASVVGGDVRVGLEDATADPPLAQVHRSAPFAAFAGRGPCPSTSRPHAEHRAG